MLTAGNDDVRARWPCVQFAATSNAIWPQQTKHVISSSSSALPHHLLLLIIIIFLLLLLKIPLDSLASSLSLCNTTCGIYVDWRTVESNTFKYPGPDIVQLNITRTRYRPTLLLHSCLPSIGYYYIPNGVDGPFISRPVYIL